MSSGIKIYKVKDFIRKTESGKIDCDRSINIVQELAAAAAYHINHNILIDLRETTLTVDKISDIMKIAIEMARFKSVFRNKIANVIPKDKDQVSMANKLKACLDIKGFQYEVFTDFEDAIEWLADIIKLNQSAT